ncbi:MAG: hypothetical protein K6U74_14050 [Firmicutes bacterium]|nr:hypothetical protein [Bacillota bacterium]
MAERVYTVREALEILKSALERCGLGRVDVSINGHDLTPMESVALVRDLLAGGFGEIVTEAERAYQYSCRPGRYSWVTVAHGDDRISLFYELQ